MKQELCALAVYHLSRTFIVSIGYERVVRCCEQVIPISALPLSNTSSWYAISRSSPKFKYTQADAIKEKSNIWVIPRGLVDNKSQEDIELQALWSPEYSGQYIIHESAVRHLKCRASDRQSIGSLRVTARINLDWSDSNHPDTGWTTNNNLFYVTGETLPDGVKAIIASERGSPNLQPKISNMAAPVQNAILRKS